MQSVISLLTNNEVHANKERILKCLSSENHSHIYRSRALELIQLLENNVLLSLDDFEDCITCLN